jgi:ubiquinone/menaquinone biosynthesis C-methylase UbiE
MNKAPARGQPPSPLPFFETVNAYQRTAALKAAIELNVFTAVAEGSGTAADVARRCGAAERGVRILCDYLAILGFLTKQAGRYALTPDSATFLDSRSPAYVGGAIEFLLSPQLTGAFDDVAAAVRKGGTALPKDGTMAPEHPVWVRFARAMVPLTAGAAAEVAERVNGDSARPIRVLDISASHGLFGLAFARRNPTARVVALDWPNVLEVARENARQAGVLDRFETLPGSAFDTNYGSAYDVVLLPNFLHHFDVPTCESLLRKVRAALKPGGRAVTVEFIPNDDRVSPPAVAAFALTMLTTTNAGDAYTFAELDSMLRNAGFARSELHALKAGVQQVVISS